MKSRIPYIYKYITAMFLMAVLLPFTPLSLSAAKAKQTSQFTVVIDAGHGGKDTGAVDNNVKEKDINLGVALQLADMIKKKLKNVKVVLTRDRDTFISLQERADRANKAKGNLFISIHTNSVDKANKNRTTVCGSSVYALGLHKDQNNMRVAQRENSVIELEKNFEQKYSGFDPSRDESYIIFEMAQKKNLSQSIKFADEAQKELVKTGGRRDRGVHQAGFWVLWATSMPAVLVELDFICNPNSAVYMGSTTGQKKLAEALFNAVRTYSDSYIKSLKEGKKGKNRADADISGDDAGGEVTLQASAAPAGKDRRHSEFTSSSRRASSSKRRRRNASSRALSDARVLETSDIPLHSESDRFQDLRIAQADEDSDTDKMRGDDKSKKGKKDKKEKKKKDRKDKKKKGDDGRKSDGLSPAERVKAALASADGKSEPAKAASRRSTRARHNVKAAVQTSTVYKIQILASVDELKQNNPRFCGLTPISSFRENNLYKYTYGETSSKPDAERLLKKVREVIPDAFIIEITKIVDPSAKK